MNNTEFMEWLENLVIEAGDIEYNHVDGLIDSIGEEARKLNNIRTFEEAMVLTNDDGLVFNMKDGSRFAVDVTQMSDWK